LELKLDLPPLVREIHTLGTRLCELRFLPKKRREKGLRKGVKTHPPRSEPTTNQVFVGAASRRN